MLFYVIIIYERLKKIPVGQRNDLRLFLLEYKLKIKKKNEALQNNKYNVQQGIISTIIEKVYKISKSYFDCTV